jgi:hypothetical protein
MCILDRYTSYIATKFEEMKKHLPLILIIASAILIVINFVKAEQIDNSFWMNISSSVLLIIAMLWTLKAREKRSVE